MGRKLLSVCLILWLVFALSVTAFAQPFDANQVGSISVTLTRQPDRIPIGGAELSLYHVATVRSNEKKQLVYTYTEAFAGCGIALDDPQLSLKLDALLETHTAPAVKLRTNGLGQAVFRDLALGLYLVKQTGPAVDGSVCMSFLVTVPYETDTGYLYDVDALPKTDIHRTTNITIQKVWNIDETTRQPDQVTVQLLREGVVIKTATLNAENGWRVTFPDLPVSDAYSVREVNIPEGFVATYTQNGYTFTVTNSTTLIQTGQLVWPIPVLAMVGVLLIAAGTTLLRKTRDTNG